MPLDSENKQRIDAAKSAFEAHQPVGEKLSKFLLRISDEIEQIDREKRLSLFRQQIEAHQYLDGNFYGYVDSNLEWKAATRGEGEVWYNDNQLYPYWRTALMELSRTKTEVMIEAVPGASDEMQAAAKFAKARYDANHDRTFNARKKQTENAYALLNGITFRYTFADFGSGQNEKVPRLMTPDEESGEISPDSEDNEPATTKICAMCARMVPPDIESADDTKNETGEEPTDKTDSCPNCGSDMMINISEQKSDTVIGYEEVNTCENNWIVPNPLGIIVQMQASHIGETKFLKWKQFVLRSFLQAKFPGIEFKSTEKDIELNYIESQQTATPTGGGWLGSESNSGNNSGRELESLQFNQVWIDYDIYCDVSFDEDTPLGDGDILKAHEKMGPKFPKGLFYSHCGDIVTQLWNEPKERKWTSSPYGLRPGSMYGSGSAIALAHQKLLNDITSLTMANAWANGVPKEFIDPVKIKELSADPTIPTNVDMSAGEGSIIGSAYAQAPPIPLSSEVYGLAQNAKDSMQNTIGAMSGSGAGGLADAQKWGDTATAISIKRDLAVGRFSPDLELMADQLDRMQAYQFLENEQDYWTPKQWEANKGDYGDDALKAFLNCNIRRDLVITISPGSYMPKSEAQMQSKVVQFAQIAPALLQTGMPELVSYGAEIFGIPDFLADFSADKARAKKVIDRFEALAEIYVQEYGDIQNTDLDTVDGPPGPDGQPTGKVPSPAYEVATRIEQYAGMPVDVFLDDHEEQIAALKAWKNTDEGQNASNALVASVALRVLKHQAGIAKQKAMINRTEIEAQQPIQDAIAAAQPQQTPQNRIAESMGYKDVPDDIKRQMEVAAGFQPSQQPSATDEQTQIGAISKVADLHDKDEQRRLEREKLAAEMEKAKMGHDATLTHKVLDIAVAHDTQQAQQAHEQGQQVAQAQIDAEAQERAQEVQQQQAEQQAKAKPAPAEKDLGRT